MMGQAIAGDHVILNSFFACKILMQGIILFYGAISDPAKSLKKAKQHKRVY
jgi:hypothetical protein